MTLRRRDEAFLFEHVLNFWISTSELPEEFVGSLSVSAGIDILAHSFGHLWVEDVASFLKGSINVGIQNLGPEINCKIENAKKYETMNENSTQPFSFFVDTRLRTIISRGVSITGKQMEKVGRSVTHDHSLRHAHSTELLVFELGNIKVIVILHLVQKHV